MRELQHRTNNAYDTILLVEDGKVIGVWTVGERGDELENFRNPGDLADWEPTDSYETDPAAYGEIAAAKHKRQPEPGSETMKTRVTFEENTDREVEYVVFTPDEAGAPDLHEGPWHFEPVTDYEGCGEVYSPGYATVEAATAAAEQDAQEQWLNEQIAKGETA